MNDITTGAGVTISLSAAAPATYTQSGYEALTMTEIGGLTNAGNPPSRVYQVVEQQFLKQRGTAKGKGGYNLGSQTITIAPAASDAGQTLLATATSNDTVHSIKISHPTLGTIYARALVMGGPIEYGDNNTPVSQQITLEYTVASDATDGVVVAPAA